MSENCHKGLLQLCRGQVWSYGPKEGSRQISFEEDPFQSARRKGERKGKQGRS